MIFLFVEKWKFGSSRSVMIRVFVFMEIAFE